MYTDLYKCVLNSSLKVSGETILRKCLSKLFQNLGPPYANNRLPYVTICGAYVGDVEEMMCVVCVSVTEGA